MASVNHIGQRTNIPVIAAYCVGQHCSKLFTPSPFISLPSTTCSFSANTAPCYDTDSSDSGSRTIHPSSTTLWVSFAPVTHKSLPGLSLLNSLVSQSSLRRGHFGNPTIPNKAKKDTFMEIVTSETKWWRMMSWGVTKRNKRILNRKT